MHKYIIDINGNKRIFFLQQYEGICEKSQKAGGWTERKNICQEGCENFFVYSDKNNMIHLVTVTKNNRLIYMICKNNEWKKFYINKINEDIHIKKIMIGASKTGKSLFYSALYKDEYILVHCILGNKALPQTIDRIYDENFFLYNNKVYYSNSDKIIGYQDFSDGKPDKFYQIYAGEMPYIKKINGKEYLIYKKDSDIFVNNNAVAMDENAVFPIIINSGDNIYVMWKNSDFIRYVLYDENNLYKQPIRHIASGLKPTVFTNSDGSNCSCFFGTFSDNKLKIHPGINPFEEHKDNENELNKSKEEALILRNKLLQQEADIEKYKNEINKLNKIIKNLTDKLDNTYEQS